MALSVASYTEMATSAAAASHVLAKPAGVVLDDFLMAFHWMAPGGSLATMTAPAGWDESSSFSTAAGYGKVFTTFAGASEPATYTFGGSAGAHSKITVVRVSGVTDELRLSWVWLGSTSAGTSHIAGGTAPQPENGSPLISTSTDALLLTAFGGPVGGSANTWTAPASHTAAGTLAQPAQQVSQLVTWQQRGAPRGVGAHTATSSLAFPGATGTMTFAVIINQPRVPVSAPGLFTELKVEIAFDGVTWSDVSQYVTRAGVDLQFGRPTRFADIGPARLALALRNHDGRFTPDNVASPYFPNVVENKPIRVTAVRDAYSSQRFYGMIRSWRPSFPGGDVTKAVTQVTATDMLGMIGTFQMPSSWINSVKYTGERDGTRWDTFILDGDGDATIYFDNPSNSPGTKARAKTVPHASKLGGLSFGSADGLSIEGSVKFNPANGGSGSIIRVDTTGNEIRALAFWCRFPSRVQSAAGNPVDVVHFYNSDNSVSYGSIRLQLNGSQDDLNFFNAAGTLIGGFAGNVGRERWVLVTVRTVTATPTQTLFTYHFLDGTGGSVLTTAAIDLRNVRHLWFGGLGNDVADMEIAGIAMWGNESALVSNPQEGLVAGTPWTVYNRISALGLITPVDILVFPGSDLREPVVTGVWHGKTALQVGQEIARSGGGVVFQRPSGQAAGVIGSNLLWQSEVSMTLNAEEDLLGTIELSRGVETRPTRITVEFPTGKSTVVDTVAEADAQEQRSQSIRTTLPDYPPAEALAAQTLSRASAPLEISKLTVDLETATHNIAEDVCEYTFPGVRIRVTGLPTTHFGTPFRDCWIEGWTERWDPIGRCRFDLDLTTVHPGAYPASTTYPSPGTYPGA